jgi:hypothetical protein
MASNFTITITPDDGAQTTVRVDASGSAPRITTLAVQAPEGTSLAPGQLPAVDLDLLLRALLPGPGARQLSTATETEEPQPVRRGRGARGGRAAGRRGKTSPSRGAKATTAKATRRSAGSRRAAADSAGGGRAYRRTPDDVAQVFGKVGSITAVAEHYGVPRHTAQGWIGRLRRLGEIPAGR